MKKKIKDLKKITAVTLSFTMLLTMNGCSNNKKSEDTTNEVITQSTTEVKTTQKESETEAKKDSNYKYEEYASLSAEEIVEKLSLEQKASQMVMADCKKTEASEVESKDYGAILSVPNEIYTKDDWVKSVDEFQQAAIESEAGIPIIYGNDQIHGVYQVDNGTIFPHQIGIGATHDKDLAYRIGQATAKESLLCHNIWSYSPIVAQSEDPRWGRTYETYGTDIKNITDLATSYTKGMNEVGMITCAKHYLGDGNVELGSGEGDRLIDRGDAKISDDKIKELLSVYQAEIDAGVQTIMVSHSALNGVKMHENKEYIMKLKDEMGFKGFISGDWDSVHNTSASTYYEQVVNAVNAGIDMFMEVDVDNQEVCRGHIIDGVNKGDISEERINDAATRIIRVKLEAGVFADPLFANQKLDITDVGCDEHRALAREAVSKSQVLIKNEKNILPLKKGTKVFVMGPAADNDRVQCGGWTLQWMGPPEDQVTGLTTIKEGLEEVASECGIEVLTSSTEVDKADVILLCLGEEPYAEWNGDTADLKLCGELGCANNQTAINDAKSYGKPIVTCIVAGRNVLLGEDYKDWDGIVMSYLPGSEGAGVADVLCGKTEFTGTLPAPWYSSVDQIGTDKCWLKEGFGLKTK